MKAQCKRRWATYAWGACLLLVMTAVGCHSEQASEASAQQADKPAAEQAAKPAGPTATLEVATAGSGRDRYVAIDDLGESHVTADEVVPELTKMLSDKDIQVRWRSARALGDYGAKAEDAAPVLRKLVAEGEPIEKIHAAAALGQIGDPSDKTIDVLVVAAADPDPNVARVAIAALRALEPGPQRTAAALSRALASDDQAILVHTIEAIVAQGADAVPLLNEALKQPKTDYLACVVIREIGPDAAPTVPGLTALLGNTKHSKVLIEALLALASIGPAAQSASPQIVALLEHGDATVPVAAAFSLGSIGATDADDALGKAAASDNQFLKMVASWALAKLHPDDGQLMSQAVTELTKGLGSSDEAMQTAAANGLEKLKAPPALVAPALVAVADDPDPTVRGNVISALASLGPEIVPHAVKALGNPKLRGLAIQVLAKLGPQAKDAVRPLIEALTDASPDERANIHFALAAIGPDAAPATEVLIVATMDEDEGVRHSALRALQQIGPKAAAAKSRLMELETKDEFESAAAAVVLAAVAPNDPEVVDKIMPVLIEGLSNPDMRMRLECVEALGSLGPAAASAAPALKIVAEDDASVDVQEAAQATLSKVGVQQ